MSQKIEKTAAIKSIEENLAQFVGQSRYWSSCATRIDSKITWAISETPFYTLNNVGYAQLTDAETAETIKEVVKLGESKQVPLIWWVGHLSTPDSLGAQLETHGFSPISQIPGMALNLADLVTPTTTVSDQLRITKVANQTDLAIMNSTSAKGIELGSETEAATLEMLSSAMQGDKALQHYIGWLDDTPVATTSMLLNDEVAGIYNVVTRPEARKKGIGSAITHFALSDAMSQGAQIGVLHSSPLGLNVYRKLGFETYCQFQLYLWGAEHIRQ